MEDATMPSPNRHPRRGDPRGSSQALESNLLPWRRPWRATAHRLPARQAHQRRLPQALPGREPAAARNPCPAPGTCCPAGGARSTSGTTSAAAVRSRPANVEEGHWGCQVVFWKPLTKTVVDDQTGEEEDEETVLRPQDLHGLLRRPGGGGQGGRVPGA